jgi:cobalt-zinc-cadmium efflux system outer membrane protein
MFQRVASRLGRTAVGPAGLLLAGCLGRHVVPQHGALPPPPGPADTTSSAVLGPAPPPAPPADTSKGPFALPPALPGADAPPPGPPRLPAETMPAERDRAVQAAYPSLPPVTGGPATPPDRPGMTLAELRQIALAGSPVIRRARAAVDAARGQVVQAGLYPNPTAGYEVDQWQPGPDPVRNNSGQQGAFLNQVIKFPGKLSLAQAVASFDYLNALVAVRRAEVDVAAAVRAAYFQTLVARQGVEINRALAGMADEVYGLQIRLVAAGEAAGYEPLQLHAQALQARNALVQSEATLSAGWRQLAAALGQFDAPARALAGRADTPPPPLDLNLLHARMLAVNTEVLTARNKLEQAEVNLKLQRITPFPDLETNTVVQYDNISRNKQFNLQLGISLPVFDRNQGNTRSALARVSEAAADLEAVRNDLARRFAEAAARYQAAAVQVENYRTAILPGLGRAYQAIVRRYQVEPGKVGFNDVVVAQQNLAQALQAYLTALTAQWQAAVDLAALAQDDDLFAPAADGACPAPPTGPVTADHATTAGTPAGSP